MRTKPEDRFLIVEELEMLEWRISRLKGYVEMDYSPQYISQVTSYLKGDLNKLTDKILAQFGPSGSGHSEPADPPEERANWQR